jgi:nickel/cobalt transporter (NicO) family protein
VRLCGGRTIATAALVVGLLLIAAAIADAQPFGIQRSSAPAQSSGVIGFILAKQAEFYRALSGLIRASKADGSALWALFGVSFAYGVFHAAGPGHGKAVISSYLVANEETWRRGIILSFASALLQAAVAVLIVAIAAALLGATAKTMADAVRWIETASYVLIAAVGARLTWVKGGLFIAAWRAQAAKTHQHEHAHAASAPHGHDHDHHDHDHAHHAHQHHDDHAGHSHGPEPQDLAGPGGLRRGLAAIVAVGLRPCSGAILVLVFALAQGLFWAGVVSTFVMGFGTALTVAVIATLAVGAKSLAKRIVTHREGAGAVVLRGLEAGAAVLVFIFGIALLGGYMVSERIAGF